MANVLRRKCISISAYPPYCFCRLLGARHKSTSPELVDYPEVKPKFPKGRWEGFTPEEAWKWYEDVELIDNLPSIEERLIQNHGAKHQMYYFNVQTFPTAPNLLDLHQEITKTVKDRSAKVNTSIADISKANWREIHNDIKDLIKDENQQLIKRKANKSLTEPEWEATKKKLLLSTIIQRLSSLLASQYPDIINTDLDSDVTIQTHWVKGGETTPPHTFCQVLNPKYGRIRYGYQHNVDYQFKSHLPLDVSHLAGVEAFSIDPSKELEHTSTNTETSEADREKQKQEELALAHTWHNPHNRGMYKLKYALPHQPGFHYGSAADFVNLSILCTPIDTQKGLGYDRDEKTKENSKISAGLVHSFAVTHAMAHYQGYDMHHDLVSPLLTQTLVTDGQFFTPITYQLNTLRLFAPDTANERYNGYSVGEKAQLFHTIDDEGNIIGYNEECIKLLAECLLAQVTPADVTNPHFAQQQRKCPTNGDILPYMPKYERREDNPYLLDGSVDIPTFLRYNNEALPDNERDLSKAKRDQRKKELEHEFYITKGPFHDSYDPPARGTVNLKQHYAKLRKEERESRIAWRDAVIKLKQGH